MTHVAKIIEIIGSSNLGWEDAAQNAVLEANRTIKGITGIEVSNMTAKVNPEDGKITTYRTSVKIAFVVKHP
ncbi:MAG: dodecin family protein [Nitrososphaeraceae archaeon]